MLKLAKLFSLPLSALYKGSDAIVAPKDKLIFDQLSDPRAIRLVRAFAKVGDADVRLAIVRLVERMAKK